VTITAIFVELLIIGLGVVCWLTLFVAFILGIQIDSSLLQVNPILIAPLTAISYVLGIVMDRLIRDPFVWLIENRAKLKVMKEYHDRLEDMQEISIAARENQYVSMELEKFIRSNSHELGDKIDYNRSRLRICRAWVFHFIMITISFAVWNIKVKAFNNTEQYWIILTGFLLFVITLYTSIKLSIDHQRDIIESSQIILMTKNKNP
jgi:hypothetical protein